MTNGETVDFNINYTGTIGDANGTARIAVIKDGAEVATSATQTAVNAGDSISINLNYREVANAVDGNCDY